jgi:mono/diheme cytochrome c family protein
MESEMRRPPLIRRSPFVAALFAAAVVPAALSFTARYGDARGADPTYAEDVAPILFRNCAGCHRPGGMAPFSVLNYDTTVSYKDEIRDAIAEGVMPPWHAAGAKGVFRNDRRLSDQDKQTILRWIQTGAKRGDMKRLPPLPAFSSSWTIGEPDAIIPMPVEFTVPASGEVEYQYFQATTPFTEDRWVQSIEVLPGANEVVHHVLVYAYAPPRVDTALVQAGAATAATPAAPAPPPVFIRSRNEEIPVQPRTDTRNPPPRQRGALIGTYVPGTSSIEFPEGTALRLRPGTIITFQMHYTAHGHEMKDRTKLGLRFAKSAPTEEIRASAFLNAKFTLPAGAANVEVPAEIGAGQAVRIWGLIPHTHLRGTRWKYELQKPDGSSEVVLDVPKYDFNWQTYYMFAKPLEMAAGTKLVSRAWYDNSAANRHNPDATKDVRWGDQTWEEMQYTGFLYSIARRP